MSALQDKVALVAGATRGAGRGIARALGEAGATVYCTGRSSRKGAVDPKRPETLEETAELVTAAGGTGVAVRVDHTEEPAVKRLFERVRSETRPARRPGQRHLGRRHAHGVGQDVLAGRRPATGFTMMERAIHTHIITSRHGVPAHARGRRRPRRRSDGRRVLRLPQSALLRPLQDVGRSDWRTRCPSSSRTTRSRPSP